MTTRSILGALIAVAVLGASVLGIRGMRNGDSEMAGGPGPPSARGRTSEEESTSYPIVLPSERLTVPQTIGLAFLPTDNVGRVLLTRANPDAREYLYRVAKSRRADDGNRAWEVIGHVGNEDDVREIRGLIERDFRGRIAGQRLSEFRQVMQSLGIMAVRKVPGSRAYLTEIADCKYWARPETEPDPVDVTQREQYPPHMRPLFAIKWLALIDEGGIRELLSRVADQCADSAMAARIRSVEMVQDYRTVAAAERREICRRSMTADLSLVSRVFNGDYENPGPNWPKIHDDLVAEADARAKARFPHDNRWIRDPDDPELKTTLQEAMQAAPEIQKLFQKRDVEAIRPRVLKNGSHELTPREGIAAAKIRLVAQRLEALSKIETKPGNVVLQTWKVWSDAKNAEITNLSIEYRLEGTEEIGREIQAKPVTDTAPRHTVDRDGTLRMVMLREDGVWRWNPFGW